MIGGPLLVLGLLLAASAVLGPRIDPARRGAVASFVLSPLDPAAWLATGSIILGVFVEVAAVALVSSAFSGGVSLLVFGVGAVLIAVGIETCRVVARVERRRALATDPRPLVAHPYRPYGSGLRAAAEAVFLDRSRWRDVIYVFVASPLAVLEFLVVVLLWSLSIGLLTLPLWGGSVRLPAAASWLGTLPATLDGVAFLLGLVLAPCAASVSRGLMALHRGVIAALLCEPEERALQRRVATLEVSRKAVLDAEATELRRIERDLHDGAQQRLVMLTMDLGMAAERIDTDPAKARDLVLEAQDQARAALAELRDLVRGIAPAILLDRGLVPALSALASRSPVPTSVSSELAGGQRFPDAVERAAYFVVAESLANVAKHAAATRCEVRCSVAEGSLIIEVADDGAGGARIMPGGGLAGLGGRVAALDGTIDVVSPSGGPTVVRATIPLPRAPEPAVATSAAL